MGYKVVQIKAKTTFQTLPEYDEALLKEFEGADHEARARSRAWCRRFRSNALTTFQHASCPGLSRP